MIKKRTSVRPWLAALVAALALSAAACGDDSTELGESLSDDVDEVTDDADLPSEDEAEDAQDSLADALSTLGLGSLSSAVEGVDVSELTDAAEFTFFAPNDDAFAAMSADELADLLSDLDQLDDVLRNHIVPERLDAETLVSRESVTTEAGNELAVVVDGDTVTVGGATVVDTDTEVGDGVVHVIDGLLLDE